MFRILQNKKHDLFRIRISLIVQLSCKASYNKEYRLCLNFPFQPNGCLLATTTSSLVLLNTANNKVRLFKDSFIHYGLECRHISLNLVNNFRNKNGMIMVVV